MKKLFFVFSLLPLFIYGQTTPNQQNRINAMNSIMDGNTSSQMLYYPPNDLNIKGSRYLYDKFVPGEVWFTDGQHTDSQFLYKFDEVESSVIIQDKEGKESLLLPETIATVKLDINGKSVYYLNMETPATLNKKKLYQLIYKSDNYCVVMLPIKKFITSQKIFHDDVQSYEYTTSHRYFLKKKDDDFTEIGLRKKDLIKALPEKAATLAVLFEKPNYKERMTAGLLAELLNEVEKKK